MNEQDPRSATSTASSSNTPSPTTSVYPSAVDLWLLIVLVMGPLAFVVLAAWMMFLGRNQDSLTFLIGGVATLISTGLFTIPCRYNILNDSVTVRCGVIFMRIPLDQIKSVELSRSWISGPALSINRVKIRTAARTVLISPVDRERFVAELNSRCELIDDSSPPA